MRRLTRVVAALCAVGLLGAWPAAAAGPGPIQAQYDGPGMGDPMEGGPMGGPGYGMGPGMGGGRYGAPPVMDPRRDARRPMGPFQSYHGFKIDLGQAQGRIDVRSALGEVEHQIDIVDRSGLSPGMLAWFRAVPIRIAVSFVDGGSHYNGGPEVSLGSLGPSDERPVLLHEYMHVLEFKHFPGSFRNATVHRFYDEARAGGLYPAQSYMMSNAAEFFAVTASCYLNGTVARDPYTRAAIRERQPDYYAYLAGLFGPRGEAAAAPRRQVAVAAPQP